jgi:hypothetical protein
MFNENQPDSAPTTGLKYNYDRESLEVRITELLFPPILVLLGLGAAGLLVISGLMS